jgi:hypothetical protein
MIIVGDINKASIIDADRIHMPEPLSKNSRIKGTRRKTPTNPYTTVGIPVISSTVLFKTAETLFPAIPETSEAHPRLTGNAIATPEDAIKRVPIIIGKIPYSPL